MKKCSVIKEMELNKYDPKWIQLRIRNRFEPVKKVFYGLSKQFGPETKIEQLELDKSSNSLQRDEVAWRFKEVRAVIHKSHYSFQKKVVDTLNALTERS